MKSILLKSGLLVSSVFFLNRDKGEMLLIWIQYVLFCPSVQNKNTALFLCVYAHELLVTKELEYRKIMSFSALPTSGFYCIHVKLGHYFPTLT